MSIRGKVCAREKNLSLLAFLREIRVESAPAKKSCPLFGHGRATGARAAARVRRNAGVRYGHDPCLTLASG